MAPGRTICLILVVWVVVLECKNKNNTSKNVRATDSCSGRCNQGLNANYDCQCNTACVNYNDCCNDYAELCLGASCAGRCETPYDNSKPCQCDHNCYTYADCCPNYESLCHGATTQAPSSQTLSSVVQDIWNADVNRLTAPDIQINTAGSNLFVSVSDAALARGTYPLFVDLLNNYNPSIGQAEVVTAAETAENTRFMDAILATEVMAIARAYLVSQNKVGPAIDDFRAILNELWFNLYSRSSSSSITDSSGFEHVMVGERTGSSVSGFHNWVQFYLEERIANLNYQGMAKEAEPSMKGAMFTWLGGSKSLGSFFLGTSPEFDLALYSVCALMYPNARCNFNLQGHAVSIQTWDINHKTGLQIGSAYPAL